MNKKIICWFAFVFFAVFSAETQQNVSAPRKFALVIGNGNYTSVTKLKNPGNDAGDIKTALESLGWTVDILLDANQDKIDTAVVSLRNRLSASSNSYGFVFYAGHAVQANGVNYLIPVDANYQSESALKSRAVSVQELLGNLNDAGNELNIVVLDACRDNPFGWSRSGSRGLVVVQNQPANSIIAFATSEGSVAADGEGRNGLYTTHFLNNLKTPGISVQELFNKTGYDVIKASEGRQRPALYQQFYGTAYLGVRPQSTSTSIPSSGPVMSFYDQLINARGTVTLVTQDAALPSTVTISNVSSITLRGDTTGRTVYGSGYLVVEKGVILTLENITLRGISVLVNKGGTLVMNNASTVTASGSVGIVVEGTFTMNEGNVTNNIDGGVIVYGGTFTMNNGKIADNYGGVLIYGGTFTMKNGRIENNSTDMFGGGVSVITKGSFDMYDGSISGNKGRLSGGVSISKGCSFNMRNGNISRNTGESSGGVYYLLIGSTFEMTGGVVYGSNGGSNANKAGDYGYAAIYGVGSIYTREDETVYGGKNK